MKNAGSDQTIAPGIFCCLFIFIVILLERLSRSVGIFDNRVVEYSTERAAELEDIFLMQSFALGSFFFGEHAFFFLLGKLVYAVKLFLFHSSP
jgi:hypothetical protein